MLSTAANPVACPAPEIIELSLRNVVRVMPNTPGQIGAGISGWCASTTPTSADRGTLLELLQALGKVVEIDPSGRPVREIPFPAMCPTMCAFGGPDLRTLYATSARHDRPADELERFPQSGGVFAMRVDVPGLPEPRYAG